MRALPLLSLFAASGLASTALSQQAPPPPPPTASAIGAVYDSVRLRPLAGAVVRLDTSARMTTADEYGRFSLDSIPAGNHFLSVEHPLLDTLGIRLRSSTERYSPTETRAVEMATPAPETLIGLFCSAGWRARGPAALVGRVREADTENAATGAKLSLVWYELDVSNGIRRIPRVREVTISDDGMFRICGLPAQLDGRAQVIRGSLTSGDIPISFGDDLLALRSMSIAGPGMVVAAKAPEAADSATGGEGGGRAAAAVTLIGNARLTGRVTNRAGQPLVGARVQVEGTVRAAPTRQGGEFQLDSLPPGTQTVTVRLLGYSPAEQAVDLSSREPSRVTITMEEFVPVLETVRVSAQRERALDDVGFARRKRAGQGWQVEGDEIPNRNALNFSDIVRNAPGIKIVQAMGRQFIQNSRDPVHGCVTIWVDGTMWQQMEPGDIDGFLKPHEIGAIEVFSSSQTPPEYQPPGRGNCSAILAWTQRRLDRRR